MKTDFTETTFLIRVNSPAWNIGCEITLQFHYVLNRIWNQAGGQVGGHLRNQALDSTLEKIHDFYSGKIYDETREKELPK
jgi:hypothetical protein